MCRFVLDSLMLKWGVGAKYMVGARYVCTPRCFYSVRLHNADPLENVCRLKRNM